MEKPINLILNMRIARYFFVGGLAAIVDSTIFFIFVKIFNIDYLMVGAIGFIIATWVNYLLGIKFVFNSLTRFSRKVEIISVYVVSGIGLILHLVILYYCIDVFYFEKMTSKITAIGLVFFWNYLARKNFVYKESQENVSQNI